MIALAEHAEGTRIVLVEKDARLRTHAGQVAFPGGSIEASDASAVAGALLLRIAAYAEEIAARRAELATYADSSLWLNPALTGRAEANLATTAAAIALLAERAAASRAGFTDLPRLEIDNGREPEPVAHEDLAA